MSQKRRFLPMLAVFTAVLGLAMGSEEIASGGTSAVRLGSGSPMASLDPAYRGLAASPFLGAPGGAWRHRRARLVRSTLTVQLPIDEDVYTFPLRAEGAPRISSPFGHRVHPVLRTHRFHKGTDFPKRYGGSVYPARSGRVLYSGWRSGYGQTVVVRHSDGQTSLYGHLSRRFVKAGDWVVRNRSLLGKVGSSGLSTGPHLHFEVRDSRGRPVDPALMLGRR